MKGKAFTLAAAAGTLFVAGTATADFVGAQITTVGTGGGGGSNLTQYHVELIFDHPDDVLNSVGGALGMESLEFNTDDPAGLNNMGAGGFGPNLFNPYGPPASVDSYLTINFNPGAATTPNLIANIGGGVGGTSFSAADDGYFVAGGDAVGAGTAVIANFVVGDGFGIGFSGLAGWGNATTGGGGLTAFSVNNKVVPGPGALALLGLAGLAGTRRRRR